MTTTIEAKRLTGIDRGKHVRFTSNTYRKFTYEGELIQVKHLGDGGTTIVINCVDHRLEREHVTPDTKIEITGRPSA